MDTHQITELIQSHLPEAEVQVSSPDNTHFNAMVKSPRFAGLSRLAQHRLVHAALGADLGDAIHALSIQTIAVDESQSD